VFKVTPQIGFGRTAYIVYFEIGIRISELGLMSNCPEGVVGVLLFSLSLIYHIKVREEYRIKNKIHLCCSTDSSPFFPPPFPAEGNYPNRTTKIITISRLVGQRCQKYIKIPCALSLLGFFSRGPPLVSQVDPTVTARLRYHLALIRFFNFPGLAFPPIVDSITL
jgi:hypothetical protein